MEDILEISVVAESHVYLGVIGPAFSVGAYEQLRMRVGNIAPDSHPIDVKSIVLYFDEMTAGDVEHAAGARAMPGWRNGSGSRSTRSGSRRIWTPPWTICSGRRAASC